ncbi:MAG: DUF6527 family protein [Solirubrobacteraceae bacterium]
MNRISYVETQNRVPTKLSRRTLLLVGGTRDKPKWALLECPCGTGHRITLPLRMPGRANWQLEVDDRGVPTIRPSVDDRRELRCHFWLSDGEVEWAPDRKHGRSATACLPGDRHNDD